jgi:hydroxyacylglutathione hydrolase
MRITAVTETHVHADYLSGTQELAAATGAQIYVSGEGGADWQYGFAGTRLMDGDTIKLGNITVQARHTPGHTPEHLAFLITDGAFSTDPGFLLSGDFVFAGDLGRPDLLDEAAGGVDTRFAGARQLFRSLQHVFLTLPDHVQVFPAHGSGSACGKALGALPSTTVGYERLNAWWGPYLAAGDEEGFVAELLDGQPDAHAYFARMKQENKDGPRLLGEVNRLREWDTQALAQAVGQPVAQPVAQPVDQPVDQARDDVVILDTRPPARVHEGTVAGALVVPAVAKAASYAAWVIDPNHETRPLVALVSDLEEAEELRRHLIRVGIDTLTGYITSFEGLALVRPSVIAPADLDDLNPAMLLDVRNKSEHAAGHVPGSHQLSAGRLMWNLQELPSSGTIVTYCQSGVRNAVAASALRRAGYDVVELDGSYAGWKTWRDAHDLEQEVQPAAHQ